MEDRQAQQAPTAAKLRHGEPAGAAIPAAAKQAKQGLLDKFIGKAAAQNGSEAKQKPKAATRRIKKQPATPSEGIHRFHVQLLRCHHICRLVHSYLAFTTTSAQTICDICL